MFLKRIEAKNFGSYESLDIDFTRMKPITVITGNNLDEGDSASNGAGKSTLVDVVSYALFGKSLEDKSISDLVNEYSDGHLEVTAWVDDIKITRSYRSKTVLKVFRINPDGAEESISTVADQNWLEKQWKINWQTFQMIYRFSGDLSYVESKADFKRKVQDTLIQADKLTNCLASSRKVRNTLNKKIDAFNRDLDHEVKEIELSESEVFDLKLKESEYENETQDAIEKIEKLIRKWNNFDFDEARAIAKEYDEIQSEIKSLNETKRSREDAVENLNIKLDNFTRKRKSKKQEIEDIDAEDDIAEIEDEIESNREKLVKLKAQTSNSDQQKRLEFEQELFFVNQHLTKSLNERKSIVTDIEAFESLEDPSEDLELYQNKLNENQDKYKSIEEQIDDVKLSISKYGDIKSEIVIVEKKRDSVESEKKRICKFIDTLESNIDDLKNLKPGTKCPTCYGPIEDGNIDGPIKKMEKDIGTHEDAIEKLDKEISLLDEEEKRLRIDLKKKTSLSNDILDLESDLDKVSKSISKSKESLVVMEADCREYHSKRAEYDANKRIVSNLDTNISAYQDQIGKLQDKIDDLSPVVSDADEAIDKLQSDIDLSIERLNASKRKNDHIRNALATLNAEIKSLDSQIEEIQSEIDSIERDIEVISLELSKLRKKRESLCYDDGTEPETLSFIDQEESRLDRNREELSRLKKALEDNPYADMVEKILAKISKRKSGVSDINKEIASLDAKRPYLDFWISAFDSDGIRSMIMKELIQILNSQSARFMNFLCGSRMGFQFDDELNLNIFRLDSGKSISYAKCSGGQKKRVNIATALAFLDTIREAANCNLNLFVVDEAADALDEVGILGFCEALHEVSIERNVWVITHNRVFYETLLSQGAGEIVINYRNGISAISE